MEQTLVRLGKHVRQLRNEKGLSLACLAEESGISVRYLTELEAGRANISVVRLARVAACLGRTAGRILEEAEAEGEARVISLLGLRGAGKSTVGPRLASRLGLPFFELDGLVEAAAGLSLGEIFALHGEDSYRRLELEILKRFLSEKRGAVLATGGGIVGHGEAFRLLEEHTETVWLEALPEDHWNRVVEQGDVRPMADHPHAQQQLRTILAERAPLYGRARHRVDTSALGVAGSVEYLVSLLGAPHLEGSL